MCEPYDGRYKAGPVICDVCVDTDCGRKGKNIHGCDFGKPSNKMIAWAFEYTNYLRTLGIKTHA